MYKKVKFKGLSLLEVLFSVVILSVIMFMFLNIFQMSAASNKLVSLNRIVMSAEDLLIKILKRSYDQNNTDITTSGNKWHKSLLASDGDNELKIYRIGKKQINNNKFRKGDLSLSETNYNNLGPEKGETNENKFNDIDDFNNYTVNNIKGYNFKVKVYYTSDESNYYDNNNQINYNYDKVDKNTNIKTIKIIADNPNTDKKVVLFYNSTNIGGSHLFSLSEIKH